MRNICLTHEIVALIKSYQLKDNNKFPNNIYFAEYYLESKKQFIQVAIKCDFVPNWDSEYQISKTSEYLSNLNNVLLEDYFKNCDEKQPKNIVLTFEFMTDSQGKVTFITKDPKFY